MKYYNLLILTANVYEREGNSKSRLIEQKISPYRRAILSIEEDTLNTAEISML